MPDDQQLTADAPPDPPAGGSRRGDGTRSRSGNAMARTRAAVLAGALRGVETQGSRRTTMGDVASLGGVAKATVYNHFRTKADVYAALVESEVRTLGEECVARAEGARGEDPLAAALEHAAVRVSEHRALRRVADEEPEVLARLLVGQDSPAWQAARDHAAALLDRCGRPVDPAAADLLVRLVASHLAAPARRGTAARAAAVVAAGLPPEPRDGGGRATPAGTGPGSTDQAGGAGGEGAPSTATGEAVPTGLGWPA